jgi:VacB/RNase II family 3'-5' exoribonuclease
MDNKANRIALQEVARKAMIDRSLEPDFPDAVIEELSRITSPASFSPGKAKDLCNMLWCSIDNAESLDLDQLSCAEQLPDNKVKLLVAIADVDAVVAARTNIDYHAGKNTSTVYTIAWIFPMLPEKLSTDLTSLSLNSARCSFVVELIVGEDGIVEQSEIYSALVKNHAKLDYMDVGAWLDGTGPIPPAVISVEGLAENIILQDKVAKKMKELRYLNGALDFETFEASPVFEGDTLREMRVEQKNRAKDLIQDLMISVNTATAQFLEKKNFPSIRRVVRVPKQWDRIVELASEHGYKLPVKADSKSLSAYLSFCKQKDPLHFSDMSHSVLKLLGSGEYVLETPGSSQEGHFGLAVKDYTHSTAPNRRYADLITQRLLKAAFSGSAVPYPMEELQQIASHCTLREDDIKKVERQVEKSAMAILLESRIGEEFDSIVTGASQKGTWIRLFQPHVEGKLVKGYNGLKVGQRLKARLIHVNAEEGFIDFERVE